MSQLRGAQADVPVAAQYPFHAITNTFRMLTAYPYARSVKPADSPTPGRTATSFIQSGRNSWAETDLKTLTTQGKASPDFENGDTQGPISLAVAVTAPIDNATPPADKAKEGENANKPETRLVVVGDSDFAANNVAGMGGNRDMFLNIVNWLAQQENLIAVRPRDPEDRRITLTSGQDTMITYFTLLILPGLIFIAGIQTWWRRR
jgi:gliding motility-associatede transport system auxiliary component